MLPKPIVIAEIGCNHGGDINKAYELISAAARSGADVVKFQKRDIESIPDALKSRPRNDEHAFGPTEYEHRKALEFTIEQHGDLKKYAASAGVTYTSSAWDTASYTGVLTLDVPWIKIPSAKNTEFLSWDLGPVPLHVSLGMTTEEDRVLILSELSPRDVPYACTSKYPCEAEDTYLSDIRRLSRDGRVVGFSGHHKGIALDIAAYVLGATYIERHFTLDRSSKGTDHAASLEPDGLRKLVRDLNAVRSAYKLKGDVLPKCEVDTRRKLKGY